MNCLLQEFIEQIEARIQGQVKQERVLFWVANKNQNSILGCDGVKRMMKERLFKLLFRSHKGNIVNIQETKIQVMKDSLIYSLCAKRLQNQRAPCSKGATRESCNQVSRIVKILRGRRGRSVRNVRSPKFESRVCQCLPIQEK